MYWKAGSAYFRCKSNLKRRNIVPSNIEVRRTTGDASTIPTYLPSSIEGAKQRQATGTSRRSCGISGLLRNSFNNDQEKIEKEVAKQT